MPFRARFDCLWCGAPHETRSGDEVEGWAMLCPECVGKAGDNAFLRFRLRQALTERGAAARSVAAPSVADDLDDWYRRRGRHSQGPIHDAAFHAELDAAGRWLDGLPLSGEIVELAAGTGWWSPLLAGKGELTLYDTDEGALDRARDRLLAHRLRAHIHIREPLTEPDRQVDAVVTANWLARIGDTRLEEAIGVVRRWLRPGGTYAFIEPLPSTTSATEDLTDTTRRAGFASVETTTTGRFLLLGRAIA
jgi:SAM-dependent methyltransferase